MTSHQSPIQRPGSSGKCRLLAGLTLLFASLGGASAANYRYYRFNTLATLSGGTAIQMSEFKFFSGGTRVVPVLPPTDTGAVTNVPAGDSPANEQPPNLVDNNTGTKWFNFGTGTAPTGGRRSVVFDFGTGTLPTVDSYTFVTAQGSGAPDGENGRNPKTWSLEGSNDGTTWDVIDVRTNHPTPLTQYTELTPAFVIPATVGPVINSFATTPVVVINGNTAGLAWATDFADSVTLSPGGTPGLPVDGSSAVTPPFTAGQVTDTTYTLEADSSSSVPVTAQVKVRTVPGGSVSGSFVRFTPVATGNGQIQIADLRFYQTVEGDPVEATPYPTSCTYTDGSGGTGGETPSQLIDAAPTTKWFNGTLRPVVFTFPGSVTFDRYAFTLGGDASDYAGRNPLRWKLEISDNGTDWDLIEDFTAFDYPMPAVNQAEVSIPLPGYQIVSPPQILAFSAERDTALAGDPVVFSWNTSGADTIAITPGVGTELAAAGTIEFLPTADATYTITATNAGGSVTKTLSFGVVDSPTGTINYTDFSGAGDEFVLLGDAALVNDSNAITEPGDVVRLRMTPDQTGKHGVSWFNQRLAVSAGFDTTFGLQLTCEHRGYGAEGLGFVIQNTAEGLAANPLDNGPASNALTVKFSTWDNDAVAPETLNEARVNLFAGGAKIHTVNLRDFPAISLRGPVFGTLTGPPDATPYLVRIAYVPGDLDVWVDDVQVITDFDVDLGDIGAIDGAGTAFVGFVARTGGWDQASDITSWLLTSSGAPANPLKIVTSTINPAAGTAAFSWASNPGKQYRITSSTGLDDWTTVLKQNIAATGALTQDNVTFTPGGARLFFRIEEQP